MTNHSKKLLALTLGLATMAMTPGRASAYGYCECGVNPSTGQCNPCTPPPTPPPPAPPPPITPPPPPSGGGGSGGGGSIPCPTGGNVANCLASANKDDMSCQNAASAGLTACLDNAGTTNNSSCFTQYTSAAQTCNTALLSKGSACEQYCPNTPAPPPGQTCPGGTLDTCNSNAINQENVCETTAAKAAENCWASCPAIGTCTDNCTNIHAFSQAQCQSVFNTSTAQCDGSCSH